MYLNIPKILQQGKGISVEFVRLKQTLPETIFETICAFLNSYGGILLLGVDNPKMVRGIDPALAEIYRKEIIQMGSNTHKLFPSFLLDVKTVVYEGKTLIHIFVPASSQVHSCNGKIYERGASGDYEIKAGESVKHIHTRKSHIFSENTIFPYLSQSHFADGVVEKARKAINNNLHNHPWNDLSDIEFFKTVGLYRHDLGNNIEGFTMAALLLFGRDEAISSALPHYKIEALLRRTNDFRCDYREIIRCNLIDAYDKLMAFVSKYIPDVISDQGEPRFSVRERIFREIIVNILIHREYSNAFPTSFSIYKDRIESKNASRQHRHHNSLTFNSLTPFPKNPHIANVFTQMGLSDELGTGIGTVHAYSHFFSKNHKAIFKDQAIFVTTFPIDENILYEEVKEDVVEQKLIINWDIVPEKELEKEPEIRDKKEPEIRDKKEPEKSVGEEPEMSQERGPEKRVVEEQEKKRKKENNNKLEKEPVKKSKKGAERLSRSQQKIVAKMEKNPLITRGELVEIVGISLSKVKENITKLKTMGIIERIGPDRGGHWNVKKGC